MSHSFLPHHERTRITAATRRRDQKVGLLIDTLRRGPMARDDLLETIHVSKSGMRKYVDMLVTAGVIELERREGRSGRYFGHPVYRVARDAALVDAYVRSLQEPDSAPLRTVEKTRHIHRIMDDGAWSDRVPLGVIPPPDPVLAAFYGIGQRA